MMRCGEGDSGTGTDEEGTDSGVVLRHFSFRRTITSSSSGDKCAAGRNIGRLDLPERARSTR